jgi:peroxiredoxin
LRGSYEEIKAKGAELVAIGTGDARYARAFVADEDIPFLVLLDDDAEAADAASVRTAGLMQLIGPQTAAGALKATAAGHRQHRTGKRGRQLGATFVIGPGHVVRYEHIDDDVSDHAPIPDVLAALP